MQNRRLLFTVIIKLLTFLGLLLLGVVFIKSLFVNDESVRILPTNEVATVSLDFSEMTKGQIKKNRWNDKEVAILFRQFPEKLSQQTFIDKKENLHPTIARQIRSKNEEYFVFFNVGDSKNCPLYYAGGEFKDICSSNRFDEFGRRINANSHGSSLTIPPHYFNENKVFFGKWQP